MEDEWLTAPTGRRRTNSCGSLSAEEDPQQLLISKAARRNAERRRRRRATRDDGAKAEAEAGAGAAAEETREAQVRALKRVEKMLRSIDALEGKALTAEQRDKVGRKSGLKAERAYCWCRIEEHDAARRREDALLDALDAVEFDEEYACGICREVLDLPVEVAPCGHSFCRECCERVVTEATCAREMSCPLCRSGFYDGVAKSAKMRAAKDLRARMKKVTGRCHCGASIALATLREHLRRCGEASAFYAPRPALGHDFAKPDFVRAANERDRRKFLLTTPRGNDDTSPRQLRDAAEATMIEEAMRRRYRGLAATTTTRSRSSSESNLLATAPAADTTRSLSSPHKEPSDDDDDDDVDDGDDEAAAAWGGVPPQRPEDAAPPANAPISSSPSAGEPLDESPAAQATSPWGGSKATTTPVPTKMKPASLRDIMSAEQSPIIRPSRPSSRRMPSNPSPTTSSPEPSTVLKNVIPLAAFLLDAPRTPTAAPMTSRASSTPWSGAAGTPPKSVIPSMREAMAADEAAAAAAAAANVPLVVKKSSPPPAADAGSIVAPARSRSLLEIAEDEARRKQAVKDRIATPWAGAVARSLQEVARAEAASRPPPPPEEDQTSEGDEQAPADAATTKNRRPNKPKPRPKPKQARGKQPPNTDNANSGGGGNKNPRRPPPRPRSRVPKADTTSTPEHDNADNTDIANGRVGNKNSRRPPPRPRSRVPKADAPRAPVPVPVVFN